MRSLDVGWNIVFGYPSRVWVYFIRNVKSAYGRIVAQRNPELNPRPVRRKTVWHCDYLKPGCVYQFAAHFDWELRLFLILVVPRRPYTGAIRSSNALVGMNEGVNSIEQVWNRRHEICMPLASALHTSSAMTTEWVLYVLERDNPQLSRDGIPFLFRLGLQDISRRNRP